MKDPLLTQYESILIKEALDKKDFNDIGKFVKDQIDMGGGGPIGKIIVMLPIKSISKNIIDRIRSSVLRTITDYTGQNSYSQENELKINVSETETFTILTFDNVTLYGEGHNRETKDPSNYKFANLIKSNIIKIIGNKFSKDTSIYFDFNDWNSWDEFDKAFEDEFPDDEDET